MSTLQNIERFKSVINMPFYSKNRNKALFLITAFIVSLLIQSPTFAPEIKNCAAGEKFSLELGECVQIGGSDVGTRTVECSEVKPCAVGTCYTPTGKCVNQGTGTGVATYQASENSNYTGVIIIILLVAILYAILKNRE